MDHLVASDLGGTNRPENLVSSCISCNSAKSDLSIRAFFARLRLRGVDTSAVGRRIRRLVRRPLDRAAGATAAEAAHYARRAALITDGRKRAALIAAA